MNYRELLEFICETYDIYEPEVAWAYNVGYLDSLTDNTNYFRHWTLSDLIAFNSGMRKGKLNV